MIFYHFYGYTSAALMVFNLSMLIHVDVHRVEVAISLKVFFFLATLMICNLFHSN